MVTDFHHYEDKLNHMLTNSSTVSVIVWWRYGRIYEITLFLFFVISSVLVLQTPHQGRQEQEEAPERRKHPQVPH